ncbi:MAG: hypothetical protein NTX85_00805 [Candidatus Nomurabacteria bacterium]|nr:hypothetical protein [Candidatus Nomurabacteria bacterium]
MHKKVTRTFLRTDETMEKYMRISSERKELGHKVDHFLRWQENLVKEFDNWVIVTNEFPYDAVASTSHMIATKREVGFDWALLSTEEREEYELIKKTYLAEHYDAIWENLPRGSTVAHHFHVHLIVLKREEI